ncbi:MAG: hypothetical protein WDN48_16985 [Pseudolabrys sp.]
MACGSMPLAAAPGFPLERWIEATAMRASNAIGMPSAPSTVLSFTAACGR